MLTEHSITHYTTPSCFKMVSNIVIWAVLCIPASLTGAVPHALSYHVLCIPACLTGAGTKYDPNPEYIRIYTL